MPVEFIQPLESENAVLNELGGHYVSYSEMRRDEHEFLNCLLLRNQPKKILEIGVSAGSSAAIMLNAIKRIPDARLYSIEYLKHYYRSPERAPGFVLDEYPELREKHRLFTGGLACDFLDDIGGDIDFCFIDTVHVVPGEALDFLMVLPYLKKDAVLVFHDTQLHTAFYVGSSFVNCLLMSAIKGRKLLSSRAVDFGNLPSVRHPGGDPNPSELFLSPSPENKGSVLYTVFPNIGGIVLGDDTMDNIWDVFNILTMKWAYMPSDEELARVEKFYSRHYERHCVEFFHNAAAQEKAMHLHTAKLVAGAKRPFSYSRYVRYLARQKFYGICERLASESRKARYRGKINKVQKKIDEMAK